MKKIILLFTILLLTGCSSYTDINNIAVVSSIGIDYKDNNYLVYVNVLSSNSKNDKELYKEECKYLDKCFESINNTLMKRLYLTHLDLLILGNSLEKDNILDIFNFFLEQKSSRNSFSVISIDSFNDDFFEIDTKDINNMIDLSIDTNGLVKRITLDDIIKDILNYENSYIPYLSVSNTLEVIGYINIYDSNKILSSDESISLNFIKDNLNNFSLFIDNEVIYLESCSTFNEIKNKEIIINISCKYEKNAFFNSSRVQNHLTTIINNFISNNDDKYFKYLYYKYKNKYVSDLNYKINVNVLEIIDNGGEFFE